jgi:hypothetical protein
MLLGPLIGPLIELERLGPQIKTGILCELLDSQSP